MSKLFDEVQVGIPMPRILAWALGLAVVVGGFYGLRWISDTTSSLDQAREFRLQVLSDAWYEMCYYSDFDSVAEPDITDVRYGPNGPKVTGTDPQSPYFDSYRLWIGEVNMHGSALLYDGTDLARAKLDAETEAEFEAADDELDEFCSDNYMEINEALYNFVY